MNIVREANQDPVTRLAALLQRVYTEGWRDGRGGAERASTNWAADAEAFLDSLTTR